MRISGYDSNTIATLFSGFQHSAKDGGMMNLTSVLSEYNSVKSGNYLKLLKKYYAQDENPSVHKKTVSSDLAGVVPKKVTATVSSAKNLSDSITNVMDSSLYQKDVSDIYKAVKDYVDDYNDLVTKGRRASVSGVATNVAKLITSTSANETSLSRIGITIKQDDTLSLDEEAFKKADMKNVEELFRGPGGYGLSQANHVSLIEYYAGASASSGGYQRNGMYLPASAYEFSSYV